MENLVTAYNGIDGYVENGVAYISLEKAARGLGFTQTLQQEYKIRSKNGENFYSTSGIKKYENEVIRWTRVEKYLRGIFSTTVVEGLPLHVQKQIEIDRNAMEESNYRPKYISYPVFFLLAMKANSQPAIKFQLWISYDVVPSILKYGYYVNPNWGEIPESGKWKLKNGQELRGDEIQELAKQIGCDYVENKKINALVEELDEYNTTEGKRKRYPYTERDIQFKISSWYQEANWYECFVPEGANWAEYVCYFKDKGDAYYSGRLYIIPETAHYSEKFAELVREVDRKYK